MRRIVFIITFLTVGSAEATPSRDDPAVQTLNVESVASSWDGFSLRSTRKASRWVPVFWDGVTTPEPISILMGTVGLIATVSVTVLAVPYDLVASPFRRVQAINLSIDGIVIDPEKSPVFQMPVSARVEAVESIDIVRPQTYFSKRFEGRIGEDGRLKLPLFAQFGPNRQFSISLDAFLPSGAPIHLATYVVSELNGEISIRAESGKWTIITNGAIYHPLRPSRHRCGI